MRFEFRSKIHLDPLRFAGVIREKPDFEQLHNITLSCMSMTAYNDGYNVTQYRHKMNYM